jgi:hypothetical protein
MNERAPTQSAGESVAAIRSRTKKTKSMTDLIYIAVVVLFFAASGRYAAWCEKL